MKLCSLLVFLSVFLLPQLSYGDMFVYTFEGIVKAELENVVDPLTALLSGDVDASTLILYGPAKSGTENSITTSTLDYAWDGTTLSGSGFIDEEKTFAGKKGGLHQGESTLTFSFTIDETSTYDLTGNFGYVGVTSGDGLDTVSWTLTGTPLSGPNYSASGTATPNTVIPPTTDPITLSSVHDQLFSQSDTITAGDYTLVLTADFHETVKDATSREAGWEIQSFTVSPVFPVTAVPEPSSFVILAGFVVAALRRRRSR